MYSGGRGLIFRGYNNIISISKKMVLIEDYGKYYM